jgi:hypothetical protein
LEQRSGEPTSLISACATGIGGVTSAAFTTAGFGVDTYGRS